MTRIALYPFDSGNSPIMSTDICSQGFDGISLGCNGLWFLSVGLCSLARLTSVYVLADVCLDVRPPIIAGYEFLGLVLTRVSCYANVMVFLYDVLS